MCEKSLSDYLMKKNKYTRWFAEKYQDTLKERHIKLLQDLNALAQQDGFAIDIEKMLKDIEGDTLDMEYLYDIERMLVSDFYESAKDIKDKLDASSTGETSFFLGIMMLKIKKLEDEDAK